MKPYTIGWWLVTFEKCIGRQIAYYQLRKQKYYERYTDLMHWIEERITEKYGER